MIYTHVGYCPCGQEIWIEFLWDGGQWFHRFFGADHREIDCCPNCGQTLHEDDLESL